MPPDQGHAGLFYLVQPALYDLAEDLHIHLLEREGHEIHGCLGNTAHGIDVAEGVGGRDLSEPVWVIHDRRKEIHGLNDGDIIGHLVNAGIICPFEPHKHIRIGRDFKPAKRPVQVPWRQFGGSPCAFNRLCQTQFLLLTHHLPLIEFTDDYKHYKLCLIWQFFKLEIPIQKAFFVEKTYEPFEATDRIPPVAPGVGAL